MRKQTMLRHTLLAAALAAAVPLSFAQPVSPGSSLGSSGSTIGAPGSTLGNPGTPGQSTGSPQVPSTGSISRPGDTRLPGSDTTPGLSTLPSIGERDRERDNASSGATRPPFGMSGTAPRPSSPGCVPGSISNPC